MSWLKRFVLWLRAGPSWQPIGEQEKSWEEVLNETGIFSYDETRFLIAQDDFKTQINWDEIEQIDVYKVDLMTTDQIDMRIILDKRSETLNEELSGWFEFISKLAEKFPEIPKGWDDDILQPPFAANFRTIFRRGFRQEESRS